MNPFEKAEKKQAVQATVVEEKKEDVIETRSVAPQVLVSSTDAYIWDRMKSQPKSLKDIDVQVVTERQPGLHRLALPKELNEYETKYTFRWIFKNKRAIDEACDVKGWIIVSRTHFSGLPNHLFTANGSIERGDNILAFMPRAKAEAMRQRPGDTSRQMLNSTIGKHKDDPNYYVPKDEEEDNVVGL